MTKVGQVYRQGLVNRIKDEIGKNENVFLLSYSQLAGGQMNDFRKALKKAGASVYVTRNSAARLALTELKHEAFKDSVNGQTVFVWSNSDSAEVSKALVKFIKDLEAVKIKGGLLKGCVVTSDDVKRISELPSREQLLSTLLSTIQAPVTRLLGALNAKSYDLLSILKQLSEKKGGS
jgi:large subunit ribosomal protein L10